MRIGSLFVPSKDRWWHNLFWRCKRLMLMATSTSLWFNEACTIMPNIHMSSMVRNILVFSNVNRPRLWFQFANMYKLFWGHEGICDLYCTYIPHGRDWQQGEWQTDGFVILEGNIPSLPQEVAQSLCLFK